VKEGKVVRIVTAMVIAIPQFSGGGIKLKMNSDGDGDCDCDDGDGDDEKKMKLNSRVQGRAAGIILLEMAHARHLIIAIGI
jgi:hypothetical protein